MKVVLKKMSMVLCLLLCLTVVLSVFNGKFTTTVNSEEASIVTDNDYEVWGAPSSVRIRRDEINFENKKGCALKYDAVKGEYENYQLVISAKNNISSYYLETADVEDGNGNKITADNFTVYREHYILVEFTSTKNSLPGKYYPDALIPIDLAKEAGELSIEKDNNAALWITVQIPRETVAGTYKGTFVLSINDKKINVPVSINVFDYTLTEDSHFKSIFNSWDKGLGTTEKDTTLEMKEIYYEFFLNYRLNLDNLPLDSMDVDELVEQAKKYVVDGRVTNFVLPFSSTGGCFFDGVLFKKQIMALAKESTTSLNLLEKASVYYIDEPEGNNAVNTAISQVNDFNKMLSEVVEEITNDETGAYDAFKQIVNWQSYIKNIRNVITCAFGKSEMYQLYNTWCPDWDKWYYQKQIDENTQILKNLKDDMGLEKEIWWYGCMSPREPYPQYHMDSDLLSSRAVNWLAQYYDVEGLLYWRVTAEDNTDIYETGYFARKIGGLPVGDGVLVYPGFKYGHKGPLPSMRLMSIRDGLEEYELLYALENKYTQLESETYSGLDVNNAVHNIYSNIHDCIKTKKDIDLFDIVRKELLAISTMDLNGDVNFVFDNVTVNQEEKTAELRIFLNTDKYTLKIDGEEISPQSTNEFIYSFDTTNSSCIDISVVDKANSAIVTSFIKEVK